MIIAFPHPPAKGGPGSFQARIESELKKDGHLIRYSNELDQKPNVIIIVGGTKRLFWLIKMKLNKVPIIFRLDGINWLHRKKKVGIKKYILSEMRNMINKFLHAFVADHIVYQSKFVENWWNQKGWKKRKNISIIYNGAEDNNYLYQNINRSRRLVILEGTIDYSPYALHVINELAAKLPPNIKIEIYGNFENSQIVYNLNKRINYYGYIDRKNVPYILKNSIYLSLDINPACPNTVIEALGCGAPVIGFKTGSLPEIIDNGAGELIPYGSNPWDVMKNPDITQLINNIIHIFNNYSMYSKASYERFIKKFTVTIMYENYIKIIEDLQS